MVAKELVLKEGLTISYLDNLLEGRETILFAHGWGADKDNLKAVYGPLEREYRIISLDLPGFGSSTAPPMSDGSPQYAGYLKSFIEQLGLANVHYAGHSFGGKIGILLAAGHPELIKTLTLINSSGLRGKRSLLWYLKVYSYKLTKFFYLKILRDEAGLERIKSRSGSDDYRSAGQMRQILTRVVSEDYTELLPQIKCPAFLYWGDKDDATPLWMAKKMEALIPNCGLYVVKGGSHYSFVEDNRIVSIIKALITEG